MKMIAEDCAMDKQMEQIISNDLNMPIEQIRKLSWNKLEKRFYGIKERAFRPEGLFVVGGNINLTLRREMRMIGVGIHEILRKAKYRIKCLRKIRRKE